MQSRKEELSSLIDSALNLENIVNFKSLHTLLHGIVDLLGSDERDERPVGRLNDASGFIDQISSPVNYVNNFGGLEGLQARIETLERNMERLQRDIAISNSSDVNERNSAGNWTIIRPQSEASSGVRENNAATGAQNVSFILEQKIDEAVAKGEEKDLSRPAQCRQPSNVISHVETGGSGNIKTSVFARDERDESSGNRITQSVSETTPRVCTDINPRLNSNDNNSDERDINLIEIIELSPSSECQEYLHYPTYSLSDSTLRLSNLETQYEHLRDEMDSLQCLREELKEKLSVEVFESIVMQWEHSSMVMEKKFTQEKNQVNDKLETVYKCLSDVERNMINQLNGLKRFLAEELLKVEEQLRKVQRSQRKGIY